MKGIFRTTMIVALGGLIFLTVSCARGPGLETPEPVTPPTFEPPPAIEEPEELPTGWQEPEAVPDESFVETEHTIQDYNEQGVLKPIYFEFDKYQLTPSAQGALRQNLLWLREHPEFEIRIEGHCDERGTEEYNLALGDRRASSARGFLVRGGIQANRFRTISYGEERPADPRHNEKAWAKNRRALLVIVKKLED